MIRFLRDIPPLSGPNVPLISVIVAARNEERHIEEALGSLLLQDYSNLEFIVVNDRSTDGTGRILDAAAKLDARLSIVHVDELPAGWLGKNYALYRGAETARGDILLFTDADIVMDPSTLKRAVAYLTSERLDHIAMSPALITPTPLLEVFCIVFIFFFSLYTRPWKAKDPKSRFHIGIGAFNMVRAHAYREAGSHQAITMRPDDDLKLGKLLKTHGFRQEFVYGAGLISVEWYASVRELIDGLMKNAFAGTDYNITLTLAGAVFHLVFSIWPFAAALLTGGTVQVLNAICAGLILLICADSAGFHGFRRYPVFGFPVGALLFVYIILRAMVLNLCEGGISWRGTRYSLKELKANKV